MLLTFRELFFYLFILKMQNSLCKSYTILLVILFFPIFVRVFLNKKYGFSTLYNYAKVPHYQHKYIKKTTLILHNHSTVRYSTFFASVLKF